MEICDETLEDVQLVNYLLFWHNFFEKNALYDEFEWFKLNIVRDNKHYNLENE